ncbi:protein YIPF6 homolog [Lepeophtheirus salmonis]|uniref:Protein YIPF n=1 Tax=Lepeophtheirus salmonis TaxID=72036 RepID=C1BTX1_LEPSM|nr:protein YIPF6 homolog [Lepeophtheirus salmonis]ACO12474.1 YIPF6 [Lepeophtheirus salmonis]ADD24539.1 Protein YIPF6 [Lepeophtheirus salmonis]
MTSPIPDSREKTDSLIQIEPEMDSSTPASLEIYQDETRREEDVVLSGKITTSQSYEGMRFDTLDEPVRVTLMKDINAVALKFRYVLYPRGEETKKNLLRDWDLWGPLILCTLMASLLRTHHHGTEFARVFLLVWSGSFLVTFNTKLLKGKISLWQSLCVLGYCLLPLSSALLISKSISLIISIGIRLYFRIPLVAFGFVWSFYASSIFLGDSAPAKRKGLALYPIFLFYLIISWMVISDSSS